MTETTTRPYPGARPFQQADRHLFSGRSHEAEALGDLWRSNGLTIAYGPAASGKTSLLQAGVLPRLSDQRFDILPPGRISYGVTFPFAGLPEHNPYTLALLRSWAPGESPAELVGLTVGEFIRRRVRRHGGVVLAPVDQAEELIADSRPRWTYRQRFLRELADALDEPSLHLLLVTHEDTVDNFAKSLGSGAQQRVAALSVASALTALTEPAEYAGRPYAAEAAEALLTDLCTVQIVSAIGEERYVVADQVEPVLLQIVASALWNELPVDTASVTTRDVRKYGDVDASLATHYGRVIARVADFHDMLPARLRSWLLGEFVTKLGTSDDVYEVAARTADMPNSIAQGLADSYLLGTELRSGTRWYRLLSDRLIVPLRQISDERPVPATSAEYLGAAEAAVAHGDEVAAGRYARVALRTASPGDFRLRAETESLLGNLAVAADLTEEARTRYQSAAELFEAAGDTPAVASELAAIGQIMLAEGKLADAIEELRAAVDRAPNDSVTRTELGLALWQFGDARGAVGVLTAVLGADGGNPEALRARGEILADLGDARAAMLDLDRVPLRDRPSTRAARALAIAELGDQARAAREIEDIVSEAPQNGAVLLYAARATALRGDEAAAGELARRAVDATDPTLSPWHRQVALRIVGKRPGRA